MSEAGSALPKHIRKRCEATIEHLIAFLDAHAPDADLEDDEETGPQTILSKMLAKDSDDSEPWLGAPETTSYGQTADQTFTWSLLGGVNGSQDYEYDPAESGIGDADGLNEQRQK